MGISNIEKIKIEQHKINCQSNIDLHVHSTCSDGSFTPEQIITHAHNLGMSIIAITDHDTLDAFTPETFRLADEYNIRLIPGIELTCVFEDELIHIIGLNINYKNYDLNNSLQIYHRKKAKYVLLMCQELSKIGIDIVLERHEYSLSHIIEAAKRKYDISKEALIYKMSDYDSYKKYKLVNISAEKAIQLIHNSEGLSILAHINQITTINAEAEEVVKKLKAFGLDGIEIYHSGYSTLQNSVYLSLAQKYLLLGSGGSDFHGVNRPGVTLGGIKMRPDHLNVLQMLENR